MRTPRLYKGKSKSEDVVHVLLISLRIMFKKWQFFVEVEIEYPTEIGLDYDDYRSPFYDSFETCYKEYLNFSRYEHWQDVYSVVIQELLIYKCGENKKENVIDYGRICYNPSTILDDFGVEADEFHRITNRRTINLTDRNGIDSWSEDDM